MQYGSGGGGGGGGMEEPASLVEGELEFSAEDMAKWESEGQLIALYKTMEKLLSYEGTRGGALSVADTAALLEQKNGLRRRFRLHSGNLWPGEPTAERADPRNAAIVAWLSAPAQGRNHNGTVHNALIFTGVDEHNTAWWMRLTKDLEQCVTFVRGIDDIYQANSASGAMFDKTYFDRAIEQFMAVQRMCAEALHGKPRAVQEGLQDISKVVSRWGLMSPGDVWSHEEARSFLQTLLAIQVEVETRNT